MKHDYRSPYLIRRERLRRAFAVAACLLVLTIVAAKAWANVQHTLAHPMTPENAAIVEAHQ